MLLLLPRCIGVRAVRSSLLLAKRQCHPPSCPNPFLVCSTPADHERQATISLPDLTDLLDSLRASHPSTVLPMADHRNLLLDDSLSLRHHSVCHLACRLDQSEWVSQVSPNRAPLLSVPWMTFRHHISVPVHFRLLELTSFHLS
jgi:hypothetical protein